jgi:hypothetical protein
MQTANSLRTICATWRRSAMLAHLPNSERPVANLVPRDGSVRYPSVLVVAEPSRSIRLNMWSVNCGFNESRPGGDECTHPACGTDP